MHDFGTMALLRQYSLLNLPTSWKASLISSYGSFLAQQQQQQASPFHRSLLTRGSVSGGSTIVPSAVPAPPLPLPPISAVASPQPPLPPSVAPSSAAPPLPLPPSSSSTSRKSNSSYSASAASARLSPNSSKQRTYPCNECGKVFNAHYNLTRHMPVHTGNISFLITFLKMALVKWGLFLQVRGLLFAKSVGRDFGKPLPYAGTRSFIPRRNHINVVPAVKPSTAARHSTLICEFIWATNRGFANFAEKDFIRKATTRTTG